MGTVVIISAPHKPLSESVVINILCSHGLVFHRAIDGGGGF